MICLLSTFSVYTLTPLTLRGCATNTHTRRHREAPPAATQTHNRRLVVSARSTLLLNPARKLFTRRAHVSAAGGRAGRRARASVRAPPPPAPHQLSHLTPALCLFLFFPLSTCNNTQSRRGSRAALTFSPMSILLKPKVLRWELLSFIAGSTVSRSTFSTNWQM